MLGNQIRFYIRSSDSDLIWSDQIRSDEVFNLFFWFSSDEVKNYFICFIFLVPIYVFFMHTSHKKTLMLCVFHFVAEKTRITTINRYAFVERAQKSWFLSDLYQIFSFFSKTIRSDQIFKYSWKHPNIWSDQIRSESDHKFCLMPNPGFISTINYLSVIS